MSQRVFVGIPASELLRHQMRKWQQAHSDLPVRWLAPENFHVTLVPPWYEDDVTEVARILDSIRGSALSFSLTFHTVEFGPHERQPRLVWVKANHSPEAEALKKSIENALEFQLEKKSFTPHVTLARFRPEEFSSFKIKTLHENVQWEEYVDSFSLIESHLERGGARYEVLQEILLDTQ